MNKKKVGVLGGTLDPIHLGHLIIAQSAKEELGLDYVLFMPSGNPPHKSKNSISDAYDRLEMTRLAISNNKDFICSDFELRRDGVIYTSDTLQLLLEENSDIELYFIMGADSLLSIESWHEPEKIFKLCHVVVADRDYHIEDIKKYSMYLRDKYEGDILLINSPIVAVSSSEIRRMAAENKSIKYLVSDDVEKYIREHRLYLM